MAKERKEGQRSRDHCEHMLIEFLMGFFGDHLDPVKLQSVREWEDSFKFRLVQTLLHQYPALPRSLLTNLLGMNVVNKDRFYVLSAAIAACLLRGPRVPTEVDLEYCIRTCVQAYLDQTLDASLLAQPDTWTCEWEETEQDRYSEYYPTPKRSEWTKPIRFRSTSSSSVRQRSSTSKPVTPPTSSRSRYSTDKKQEEKEEKTRYRFSTMGRHSRSTTSSEGDRPRYKWSKSTSYERKREEETEEEEEHDKRGLRRKDTYRSSAHSFRSYPPTPSREEEHDYNEEYESSRRRRTRDEPEPDRRRREWEKRMEYVERRPSKRREEEEENEYEEDSRLRKLRLWSSSRSRQEEAEEEERDHRGWYERSRFHEGSSTSAEHQPEPEPEDRLYDEPRRDERRIMDRREEYREPEGKEEIDYYDKLKRRTSNNIDMSKPLNDSDRPSSSSSDERTMDAGAADPSGATQLVAPSYTQTIYERGTKGTKYDLQIFLLPAHMNRTTPS